MKCRNCGSENLAIINDYWGTNPYTQKVKCQDCGYKYDIYTNQLDIGQISSSETDFISIPVIKRILIVEDGSIDLDSNKQDLRDLGIKVLIYKKGSEPPRLYNLED